jgi:hypothetical protein
MSIRSIILALTLALGTLSATSAGAFFGATSTRPPPYGGNGLATNGFSLKGLSFDVASLKGAMLSDGTIIELK